MRGGKKEKRNKTRQPIGNLAKLTFHSHEMLSGKQNCQTEKCPVKKPLATFRTLHRPWHLITQLGRCEAGILRERGRITLQQGLFIRDVSASGVMEVPRKRAPSSTASPATFP